MTARRLDRRGVTGDWRHLHELRKPVQAHSNHAMKEGVVIPSQTGLVRIEKPAGVLNMHGLTFKTAPAGLVSWVVASQLVSDGVPAAASSNSRAAAWACSSV